MAHLDQYEVTFEWSDESETSVSCRAGDFHAALAEATNDEDAMIPSQENAEVITVTIHNNSADGRQDSHERDDVYAE